MAEQPEESDSEDEDSDSEEETVFDESALTSFRMFHQRINGEEIEEQEEEDDDDWGTVDSDEDDEQEVSALPDSSYVAEKLLGRGITFEDLVKDALFNAHSNWGDHFSEYERRSSEVYGQFRAVITQFSPSQPPVPLPTLPLPTLHLPTPLPTQAPQIAEAKTVAMPRRRECMVHV
jgi:hypothetical protein